MSIMNFTYEANVFHFNAIACVMFTRYYNFSVFRGGIAHLGLISTSWLSPFQYTIVVFQVVVYTVFCSLSISIWDLISHVYLQIFLG